MRQKRVLERRHSTQSRKKSIGDLTKRSKIRRRTLEDQMTSARPPSSAEVSYKSTNIELTLAASKLIHNRRKSQEARRAKEVQNREMYEDIFTIEEIKVDLGSSWGWKTGCQVSHISKDLSGGTDLRGKGLNNRQKGENKVM